MLLLLLLRGKAVEHMKWFFMAVCSSFELKIHMLSVVNGRVCTQYMWLAMWECVVCAFTNNIDLYTVVVTVVAVVVLNAYTGDAAKCFLFPSLRSYRIRHPRGLTFGFFTTARTASWNTSSRLCFFFAEHSTSAKARILCFNFLPSASVTNFSEFGTRRSLFVPAKWRENCHVIMNSHTFIYSI